MELTFEGDGRRVSEGERARLLLPRPALAGCIALGIVRDTRGIEMSDAQRVSHFPRSPYCGVSWVLEGEVFELQNDSGNQDKERMVRLPDLAISGPRAQPMTMWSPGPAYGLTVVLYPDAWLALTGVELNAVNEKSPPADDVLSGALLEAVKKAASKQSVEEGFDLFQTLLTPLWQAKRPQEEWVPFWFKDWATALAMRAASSGAGRSLRQLQRRVKSWAGFSQRDLNQQGRVEQLFARSREVGVSDLAGLAQEFGYADQAHMGRQVRKITGAPPAKISELIETQESYWIYRLMGERLAERE